MIMVFGAEFGKLGYSSEEVLILEHVVAIWEELIEVLLAQYMVDADHIFVLVDVFKIVNENHLGGLDPLNICLVLKVRNAILNRIERLQLRFIIIVVPIRPWPIILDSGFEPDQKAKDDWC